MLKCTAFFTLGIQGWGETWFLDGSNLGTAATPLNTLVAARLKMTPATISAIGGRISVVENPAIFRKVNSYGVGTYTTTRDVTNMAILWGATTAIYNRRQIYTRGTPDDCVTSGVYTPTTQFAAAASDWANQLIALGFAIRCIDKTNALQNIATIDATGLLTTYADYGWDKADVLKFQRAKFADGKPFKKPYSIGAKLTGTTYQLVGWPAGKTAVNVRARKLVYFLDRPVQIYSNAATTRKTGRPFGLRAGRRRVTAA